jgi:O-antigen/teichoic acid export membrane protein
MFRSIALLSAANILNGVSQWFYIVILARNGNQDSLGSYSYALAICAPVFMFLNFQLRSVYISQKLNIPFENYFSIRIALSLLAFFLILLNFSINNFFNIIAIVAALKLIESLSDILNGKLQMLGHIQILSLVSILKSLSAMLGFYLVYKITGNYESSLIFVLIIIAIFLLVEKKLCKFRIVQLKNINYKNYIKIISYSFPLAIVMGMISLSLNMPKYFLEKYGGIIDLGIFNALFSIILASGVVVNSIGQFHSKDLADLWKSREILVFIKKIKKLILLGCFFSAALFILSIFFYEYLIIMLYGKEFLEYKNTFMILVFASFFMYSSSYIGYALTASHYFWIQVYIFILVLIIAYTSSRMLIPIYGLMGASYTVLIIYLVQFSLVFLAIYFLLKKQKL